MPFSSLHRPSVWLLTLVLLFGLGLTLRLIDLTDPPLDFHSSRQLRNSLVARDIYYHMLPGLEPQTLELTASFRRAVGQYEPPIIEWLAAVAYLVTGGENIAAPRILESFFWMLAGIALFDLARRAVSPWAALAALAYYFILPFAVQASRSFQPDPLMTSAFVAGIYFLYRWSESYSAVLPRGEGQGVRGWRWAILAGACLAFATLVKIVIVFLAAPAAIAMVLFTLRKDFWRSAQVWAMAGIMAVPSLAYYVFLHPGRSSEYFLSWSLALIGLITSTDFYSRWLGFLGGLFGLTVLFASLAGIFLASSRLRWLLVGLWIGYLLYGLTLPFQMYTHSYYHIQLVPVVALGLAAAVDPLFERAAGQGVAGRAAFVAVTVALIAYQAWVARSVLIAEDFRREPAVWKQIGEAIPQEAHVIGLTQDYGFRLMLWGWRKVSPWPVSSDLAELRGASDPVDSFEAYVSGKDYFLVTAFGQMEKQPALQAVLDRYPIAAQGDGFVLYDLR
jgi:4-amino-4-deoxy-L-arabinose transferase-like glycosyltransferase